MPRGGRGRCYDAKARSRLQRYLRWLRKCHPRTLPMSPHKECLTHADVKPCKHHAQPFGPWCCLLRDHSSAASYLGPGTWLRCNISVPTTKIRTDPWSRCDTYPSYFILGSMIHTTRRIYDTWYIGVYMCLVTTHVHRCHMVRTYSYVPRT